jgi:uncharacterized protein
MLGALKKMGSINFNNLKNTNYSQKKYTYTDIYLDLTEEPSEIIVGNRNNNSKGRDIKAAYDINAIKNSIINLFNTVPGERFLLPDYGCDLRQYIFEPISETNARFIGRTIKRSISQWEPRVKIVNISIDAYIDKQQYVIILTLNIPFLQTDTTFNFEGILNKQGFTVK